MRTTFAVMGLLCLIAATGAAQVPAPNASGVTMGHMHIKTPNLEVQKKFWNTLLESEPVRHGPLEVYKFPGGLLLLQEGASNGGSDGSVVNHFGFLAPNVRQSLERLKAAGFEMPLPPEAGRGIFINAPDAVRVELTQDASIKAPAVMHHIHLWNNDVDGIKAWYVKTFGAKGGRRANMEAADLPGVNLTFAVAKGPVVGTKGRALDHIGFEVKNLEAFCRKLEASGVRFAVPYKTVPALGIGLAFFSDPWGTYIELTEGLERW